MGERARAWMDENERLRKVSEWIDTPDLEKFATGYLCADFISRILISTSYYEPDLQKHLKKGTFSTEVIYTMFSRTFVIDQLNPSPPRQMIDDEEQELRTVALRAYFRALAEIS